MNTPKFNSSRWIFAAIALLAGLITAFIIVACNFIIYRIFGEIVHLVAIVSVGLLGVFYAIKNPVPRKMAIVSVAMSGGFICMMGIMNDWFIKREDMPYALVFAPCALFAVMGVVWFIRRKLAWVIKSRSIEPGKDGCDLDVRQESVSMRRYGVIALIALFVTIGIRQYVAVTYEVTFISDTGTVMGSGVMTFHPLPFKSKTSESKTMGECEIKLNPFSAKTGLEKDFRGIASVREKIGINRVVWVTRNAKNATANFSDAFNFPVRFNFSPGWHDSNIDAFMPSIDTEVSRGKLVLGTFGGGSIGGEVILKRK